MNDVYTYFRLKAKTPYEIKPKRNCGLYCIFTVALLTKLLEDWCLAEKRLHQRIKQITSCSLWVEIYWREQNRRHTRLEKAKIWKWIYYYYLFNWIGSIRFGLYSTLKNGCSSASLQLILLLGSMASIFLSKSINSWWHWSMTSYMN